MIFVGVVGDKVFYCRNFALMQDELLLAQAATAEQLRWIF